MGQIKLLDQNMINMIAAGEVIERPASVVKELMENSIDAGAIKIIVSIEDGGKKLISITDNGCGMDTDDLARAFEPHTTSKIKTSNDLRAISTLGFRGEALASIASIAQVKAVSRTKESASANCIEIDCGNNLGISPCSADYGTSIQIRDLFYKLPARRKFLRTTNTEMGHITEQFTRIALTNCRLDMTLLHNGRELHHLPGGQSTRERISKLFLAEISENLIQTDSDEKQIRISAFLGKPEASRTSNKFQYIFLNGRSIRDKFISHAIKEAYRGTLESDRYPIVFLFIQMPYEDYDVNVHPTKSEVRFYNANLVHSQILGCLREKLLATTLDIPGKLPSHSKYTKQADVRGTALPEQRITDAMADFFKKHKPIQTQSQFYHTPKGQIFRPSVDARNIATEQTYQSSRQTVSEESGFLQIHDSYIIEQTNDGFVIIDQHALHERILYEHLSRRLSSGKLESQKLLIPETFELTDAQADVLANNSRLIEQLGIELAPFGPHTIAIQAFPSILARASAVDFVRDLIDLLTDKNDSPDSKDLLQEVLNMAACKAAIKAGQKLTAGEIRQLLADRQRTEWAGRCPHGRPSAIKFTISDLEKQFKRT